MTTNEKCLICGKPVRQRGLCVTHHSRFYQAKMALPPEKREAFEAELIRKNLLSPPKPRGRQVESDVFADIADRLLTQGEKLDREAEESIRANPPGKTAKTRKAMRQPRKPNGNSNNKKEAK